MAKDNQATRRRKARVRRSIRARAYGKPRLIVFRSSKQIYRSDHRRREGRDSVCGLHRSKKTKREGSEDRRRHRRRQERRQADRGARRRRRHQAGRVRPWRLHVSRPRQGAGRRRPRGRPRISEGARQRRVRAGYSSARDGDAMRTETWRVKVKAAGAAIATEARTANSWTGWSTSIASPRW